MDFKHRNLWEFLFVIILTLVLGGCGGGGGSDVGVGTPPVESTLRGVFIDGPVEGLTYVCTPSNLSGVTDSNGAFSYRSGDNVVFKVGNISLPSIPAAGVIYPLSYFSGNASIEDADVLNLVRFIMSAGDVGAEGKIRIRANPFAAREGTFPDVWNTLIDANEITVSTETARTHVESALLVAYAGNYSGTWNGVNTGYGTSITMSGSWSVAVDESGSVSGSYNGSMYTEQLSGSVSGYVSANGNTVLDAIGQAGVVIWSGKIDLATGNLRGTFSGTYDSGTFSGQKK